MQTSEVFVVVVVEDVGNFTSVMIAGVFDNSVPAYTLTLELNMKNMHAHVQRLNMNLRSSLVSAFLNSEVIRLKDGD